VVHKADEADPPAEPEPPAAPSPARDDDPHTPFERLWGGWSTNARRQRQEVNEPERCGLSCSRSLWSLWRTANVESIRAAAPRAAGRRWHR
jgi:hypothetical protein